MSGFSPPRQCLLFQLEEQKSILSDQTGLQIVIVTTSSQTLNMPHISPRCLCGPASVISPFTIPNLFPCCPKATMDPKQDRFFQESFG